MYKKILVTLDGSKLAECSLDHVRAIALGCNSQEVILLQVLKPLTHNYVPDLLGIEYLIEAEEKQKAEAENYISEVANKLKGEGLPAKTVVVPGDDVAGRILDYTRDHTVDLIILSTHGRSGPSRWAFGSVADRVVRHSPVPVLMVSPSSCRINQVQSRRE